MRRLQVAISTIGVLAAAIAPALAQNGDHTNLSHFYMARQQIDILDDAPAVNDMRTQPGAAAQRGASGALPNRPVGLPRAGFMPYSQNLPSVQSSLPKTFNGVPPKAPPQQVNPNLAKANKFKAPRLGPPPQGGGTVSAPTVAKRYSPYRGYGLDGGGTRTSSGGSSATSTALHGSLMNQPMSAGSSALHWSRTRSPQ
jgi:hypothetical protein